MGFDHEYNLHGDRLQDRHLHNSAHSETYNYDSSQRFDRLEREDGFQQSWQLDKLCNWTQFDNNGQVEDSSHSSVNEITSITPDKTLTYDDKGNMTFHKDKNYVYDANNRLTHVYKSTSPGQVARYYYSAMNQRVMKHVDTDDDGLLDDKTVYIYCHQKVCEEQGENGNFKRDYIHGGQFIDEVVMTSDSPDGLGSFTLTDLRYSVYAVVDSQGEVVERYQYTPYGERTVMTASFVELSESEIGQEFGYTGRRHDAEDTGLMYFRAQYYSGELGRFVSRDPLGTALDVRYFDWQRQKLKIQQQLRFYGISPNTSGGNGAGSNYADGMNLYASYFHVNGIDPSGMTVGEIANFVNMILGAIQDFLCPECDAYSACTICCGATGAAMALALSAAHAVAMTGCTTVAWYLAIPCAIGATNAYLQGMVQIGQKTDACLDGCIDPDEDDCE